MKIKVEFEFDSREDLFGAINSKIIQINAFGYAITQGKYPDDTLTIINAYDGLIKELKQLIETTRNPLLI